MPQASPVGPAPTTSASNDSLTACSPRRGRRSRARPRARRHPCRRLRPCPGRPPPLPPTACATRADQFAGVHFAGEVFGDGGNDATRCHLRPTPAPPPPLFHLLRSESASARICWRSMPSSRAASTLTPLTVARLRFQSPDLRTAPACSSIARPVFPARARWRAASRRARSAPAPRRAPCRRCARSASVDSWYCRRAASPVMASMRRTPAEMLPS